MLNLTARCPHCDQSFRTDVAEQARLECPQCGETLRGKTPALNGQAPDRCFVCPSTELFVRKDFPQRLGVGIVVTGFVLSSVAWYAHQVITSFAILFGTALIDVALYLIMGNVLECYRCHAQYRGLASLEGHEAFNLEIHERYRQQAARLAEQTRAQSEASPPIEPKVDS